jgi:hypothetical protein
MNGKKKGLLQKLIKQDPFGSALPVFTTMWTAVPKAYQNAPNAKPFTKDAKRCKIKPPRQ